MSVAQLASGEFWPGSEVVGDSQGLPSESYYTSASGEVRRAIGFLASAGMSPESSKFVPEPKDLLQGMGRYAVLEVAEPRTS